ncbi:MAG TPA: hypothetical protein VGG64_23760 [Pirellulales bacterium]
MLGVLSRLVVAIAVVLGPPLAGWCSAQFRRPEMGVRQVAYWENSPPAPEPENVPPGRPSQPAAEEQAPPMPGSEFVGEFGDALDGNDSIFPGDSFEEEQESLIPDGLWNNRGPLWYSSLAVTLIQRSAPSRQDTSISIARIFVGVPVNTTTGVGVQITGEREYMTDRALSRFDATPGMRLTFGRNLFEDIIQRQHSIEFSYLGLNNWQSDSFANGPPRFIPINGAVATLVAIPGLYSKFPVIVGGFNPTIINIGETIPAQTNGSQTAYATVSRMTIAERSTFNNFEMNYRIGRLPRPDRVAQRPDGSWVQVGTPTLVHSLLAGVRVFTFNDHFNWNSTGTRTFFDGTSYSGVYNAATSNTLVGGQIGADIFMHTSTWTMGVRSKAGIYGNSARQSSNVTIVDQDFGNSASSTSGGGVGPAFIGDLGVVATRRMFERAYLRFSYDFMWVGGIANAPEQVQYTNNLQPVVRKNGALMFQGVSLGFDFCW